MLGQEHHQVKPKGPQITKYWPSTNISSVSELSIWDSGQQRVCEKHKARRGHEDVVTRVSGSWDCG